MAKWQQRKTGIERGIGGDAPTVFAKLIDAPDEETFPRIRQAVMDGICGVRTVAKARKRMLMPGETEECFILGEEEEVYFYTRPPDFKLLSVILEHHLGKPAQRNPESFDPEISIITAVEGYAFPTVEQEGKGASPAAAGFVDEEEATGGRLQALMDGVMEELEAKGELPEPEEEPVPKNGFLDLDDVELEG